MTGRRSTSIAQVEEIFAVTGFLLEKFADDLAHPRCKNL